MPDWGVPDALDATPEAEGVLEDASVPAGVDPVDVVVTDIEVARALEEEPQTPRQKAAYDLLVADHLSKLVAELPKAKRAAAQAVFTKSGQREPAELNGVPLGAVNLNNASGSWQIADRPAFLAWVSERRPLEVLEQINADELEAIRRRVWAVMSDWAEAKVLDGLAVLEVLGNALEPAKGAVGFTVAPAFEAAVLKAAADHARVDTDDGTGEEVLAEQIPGVRYTPGTPTLAIQPLKGDALKAARQAVLEQMGSAAAILGLAPADRREVTS